MTPKILTLKIKFLVPLFLIIGFFLGMNSVVAQTTETFFSSGIFTVPAGVTSLTIEAWGGGGGGADLNSTGGGGGGGGAYSSSSISVTPGSQYSYTVGIGGAIGSDGGESTVSPLSSGIIIKAGGGIRAVSTTGGSGGTASLGSVNTNGAAGANEGNGNSGGDGGNAGGLAGGLGGAGGGKGSVKDGTEGATPGGGGGGGTKNSSGARGGYGQVSFTYTCPPSAGVLSGAQIICFNGNTTYSSTVAGGSWSSGNIGIATVNSVTGLITPIAAGTATITYTVSSIKCTPRTAIRDITINAVPTAGNIGNSQTICSGGDPAVFTNTGVGTGDGTITYRWESAVSPFSSWTPISNVFSSTFDAPSGLTATTRYRRITISTLNSVACESVPTPTVQVTVNPASVGGTATAGASTVCSGSATTINLTGSTGTIQWQQSSDGSGGWATVTGGSGGTTATYTTPNHTATTHYRALVTSGVCASANSTTALVTVSPPSPVVPVSSAGTAATCAQITANWSSSTNATTYFLDVSTVNTFGSFVSGYNNLNVGNVLTLNITGLTAGTNYYYRVRASNSCGTSVSSGIISYSTLPAAPAAPSAISGATAQCPGSMGQVYSISPVTDATTYSWAVPTGWIITSGTGTISITVTSGSAGQNGNITVSAGNTCGTSTNTTLAVTVGTCINKWKGSLSSNWNTPGNWTQNVVPAIDASIIFDDAPVNHLVLDQNRSVTNITNAQSLYRVVCNGYKLVVKGNTLFTNGSQIDASAASSVVEFSGNAAQSIPAGAFYNDAVFNFTVNNINNVTVNGNLRVLNTLTASSGRVDAFSNSPTIIYGGASVQTIDSGQYLNEKMFNLNINNAAGVNLNANFTLDNNLTINVGKIFAIEAAKNLTVVGAIANSGGISGLVLRSNASGTASLIHNTIDVPATVQRYISGAAEDWHFLSAPVSNQSISGGWNPAGTYGNGTGYDLYIWNEPTPCWTYQLNTTVAPTWPSIHPTSHFVKGRGYLYSTQAANPTKEFIGVLNNGTISIPVTNVGPDTSPEPDVRGFNLIGNPYPSAIDWKSTGWTRNNLLVTGSGYDIWIWNPAAKNYGVYNTTTVGSTGTHGVTQNIAPMQGFYVRAASNGSVGMTNTIRVNTGASNWMKTKNNETNNLKVRIASDSSLGYDEVLVQFGASLNEAGAAKLFSTIKSAPSLYLTHGKEELTVLNLTNTVENTSVPLMFKAGSDGNYTLTINLESKGYEVLLLEDKKTKTISDLKVNPKYQFKGSIKDAASRFVLHFAPINNGVASLPAVIYYDGNQIIVDLTLISEQTEVKIYDMLGKLLVDKKAEGKMIHRFDINPKNEVYIVVGNSKGKSISRKILAY